jgi:2-aminobenzoate-CoA ligase
MNLAARLVDAHVDAGRGRAPAVLADGRPISYSALQDRVRRLAAGLQAAGAAPADRIVIALPNGPDLIAVWLAVQHLGAIAVAVPHTVRRRELEAIVTDAEPRLVVGDSDGQAVAGVDALSAGGREAPPPHASPPEAPAVIAYATAADGRPVGAWHSADAILASADGYGRGILNLGPGDIVGGHPPVALAYGLGALLVCPLAAGAATAPAAAFDAESLLGSIARDRVTVFFGTATCYRLLLRLPDLARRFDLSSLRACVSAGEPLDARISEAWSRAAGVDLLDGFGTTELFHIVIAQRPGQVRHGALGRPVPGYEVRVVDDDVRDVPPGREGRLAVRGPTGCRYWRRAGREREVVRDGWTLTGDVVVRDEDGFVWFRRRADALIVSAGYNVAPAEVEAVLEAHPAVARATVSPAPDPTRGAIVSARIVLRPGAVPSADLAVALQQHAQRELSPYKCPRRIEFVS